MTVWQLLRAQWIALCLISEKKGRFEFSRFFYNFLFRISTAIKDKTHENSNLSIMSVALKKLGIEWKRAKIQNDPSYKTPKMTVQEEHLNRLWAEQWAEPFSKLSKSLRWMMPEGLVVEQGEIWRLLSAANENKICTAFIAIYKLFEPRP